MSDDIIVVASCNVDLISYVERFPQKGETLMGLKFQSGFGGKGANKAIAASRLGSNVSVISKLGNDVFGRDYHQNFKDNNINTDHVFFTNDAATGVAPICVDKNGANLLLSIDDVKSCENLIKSSKILVTNLEIATETAFFSLKLAHSNNATTNIKKEIWAYIDYLILNEVEIEQLSKLTVQSVDDAKQACLEFIDSISNSSIKGLICTLGENGVIYLDCNTKNIHHKQLTNKVKVVDSAGAGDSFCGAFVHYLNKCNDVIKSVELAAEYASLTVQLPGTQSSYSKLADLDDKFKI